jgi:hypothetical protein
LKTNPEFSGFVDALDKFRKFSEGSKDVGVELRGEVPTGYEKDPVQFEKRLDNFNWELARNTALFSATLATPAGELNQRWFNLMDSYFDHVKQQRDADRKAAGASERGGEGPPPTIVIAPPPTTTLPPTPAGGVSVLEDRLAQ